MKTAETMIIASLLDNDFYKFTMQNAVIKLFPNAHARYTFINRGHQSFPTGFAEAVQEEVGKMASLKLKPDEKTFLWKNCPYLDPTYLDFLSGFQYHPDEVSVSQRGGDLQIEIEGYWYRTILWEVPVMAIVSELYYVLTGAQRVPDRKVSETAREKIQHYRKLDVRIADFGTRRRYSYEVQQLVVQALKKYGGETFTGTSNVDLAMKLGTRPIGTHAHEWFMFHAARYGFKTSNSVALENWVEVYRGDLGIALSDTYTSSVFFESFDKKFSKLFDGVRHDSGDPLRFAQKTIDHYASFHIDPLSKTIIFSDSLNPDKVDQIAAFCRGKIGMSFGIGTNFTNDVGPEPLNIVLKMTDARPQGEQWIPVVKLSDDPGKYTGDPEMIRLAKTVLGIEG